MKRGFRWLNKNKKILEYTLFLRHQRKFNQIKKTITYRCNSVRDNHDESTSEQSVCQNEYYSYRIKRCVRGE